MTNRGGLPQDAFRLLMNDLQHRMLRGPGVRIHEVHDHALRIPNDSSVGLRNKITDLRRMPVIATGFSCLRIQTLLHNGPFSVSGEHKTVKVDLKTISDGIVVDT